MPFTSLKLHPSLLKGVKELGFARPTRRPSSAASAWGRRRIDIEALDHVVNFDVPKVPEEYIHRVGRTAGPRRWATRSPS